MVILVFLFFFAFFRLQCALCGETFLCFSFSRDGLSFVPAIDPRTRTADISFRSFCTLFFLHFFSKSCARSVSRHKKKRNEEKSVGRGRFVGPFSLRSFCWVARRRDVSVSKRRPPLSRPCRPLDQRSYVGVEQGRDLARLLAAEVVGSLLLAEEGPNGHARCRISPDSCPLLASPREFCPAFS